MKYEGEIWNPVDDELAACRLFAASTVASTIHAKLMGEFARASAVRCNLERELIKLTARGDRIAEIDAARLDAADGHEKRCEIDLIGEQVRLATTPGGSQPERIRRLSAPLLKASPHLRTARDLGRFFRDRLRKEKLTDREGSPNAFTAELCDELEHAATKLAQTSDASRPEAAAPTWGKELAAYFTSFAGRWMRGRGLASDRSGPPQRRARLVRGAARWGGPRRGVDDRASVRRHGPSVSQG